MVAKEEISHCPCGSGLRFKDCCGRYVNGGQTAPSAESLMRSRYTAFALGLEAYLLATWHFTTRPAALALNEQPAPKWIGLQVLRHAQQDESHALVEFVARYKINGRACKMRETSRFVREDGEWFYVEGESG